MVLLISLRPGQVFFIRPIMVLMSSVVISRVSGETSVFNLLWSKEKYGVSLCSLSLRKSRTESSVSSSKSMSSAAVKIAVRRCLCIRSLLLSVNDF